MALRQWYENKRMKGMMTPETQRHGGQEVNKCFFRS